MGIDVLPIRDFRDLDVWNEAMHFTELVHRASWTFPRWKSGALASQLQGSFLSVPSNIAEGKLRASRKDYAHFITMARSSLAESRTQLILAHRLEFLTDQQADEFERLAGGLAHRLNALRRALLNDPPRALQEPEPEYDPWSCDGTNLEVSDHLGFANTQHPIPNIDSEASNA